MLKIRYISRDDFYGWLLSREEDFSIRDAKSTPWHKEYAYGEFLEEVCSPLLEDGYEIIWMDWEKAITVLRKTTGS